MAEYIIDKNITTVGGVKIDEKRIFKIVAPQDLFPTTTLYHYHYEFFSNLQRKVFGKSDNFGYQFESVPGGQYKSKPFGVFISGISVFLTIIFSIEKEEDSNEHYIRITNISIAGP